MITKLTLSIDDVLKNDMKGYAGNNETDLSYLVSSFFKTVLEENNSSDIEEITPLVKELTGVIPEEYSGKQIDDMYKKYLEEKYL